MPITKFSGRERQPGARIPSKRDQGIKRRLVDLHRTQVGERLHPDIADYFVLFLIIILRDKLMLGLK